MEADQETSSGIELFDLQAALARLPSPAELSEVAELLAGVEFEFTVEVRLEAPVK